MKDTLRNRFSREMTVRGLSQRTQDSYLLNVSLLVKRTGKHPTKLATADLGNYFAWMVNVHAVESSTYRQHLAAVKLFFVAVLKREEEFFNYASPKQRRKLPVVLSLDETHRMLNALHVPRIRSAAVVTYSCGLRRSEVVSLSVDWISSEAGSLHIHNAKGLHLITKSIGHRVNLALCCFHVYQWSTIYGADSFSDQKVYQA